jgi:NADP-dependent alcohol dehydrogenase
MIGHELTAFHGIDHGQTLCIVLPGLMSLKRKNKEQKLLQFGERIWEITEGTTDEKIDATIARTVEFFESVGIKTKLSDYGVGREVIAKIVDRFASRGVKGIGERGDLTLDQIAEILESRLS